MLTLSNHFARRALDGMADEQTLIAARALNQAAAELMTGFEGNLKGSTWRDSLIGQGAFLQEKIEPKVRAVAEPLADRLLGGASKALSRLVDRQAQWKKTCRLGIDTNAIEGLQALGQGVGAQPHKFLCLSTIYPVTEESYFRDNLPPFSYRL